MLSYYSTIKEIEESNVDTVILPIQDIFGFGRDTRMNTPGVALGNWAYRITRDQLFGVDRGALWHLNKTYFRFPCEHVK